jgi:hypothetical protein
MALQINPITQQYVCIFFIVVGALATATPSVFPSYLPQGIVTEVIQTAGFVTFLWNIVHGAMAGFSSTVPGPWAPKDEGK